MLYAVMTMLRLGRLIRIGRRMAGHFWTIATAMLLLNFFLLTYNVHFSLVNKSNRPRGSINGKGSEYQRNSDPTTHSDDTSLLSGYQFARTVQNNCKHFNKNFEILKNFWITRMHVISKHSSIYCPVEKVGTTFWRRFIYHLNHTSEVKNTLKVSIMKALTQKFDSLKNTTKPDQLGDYFKFMFVRDPYNRILSAYIDKLFVPNPLFWNRFGKPAITRFRVTNGSTVSRNQLCYSDPTFTEFLQFATWSGRTRKHIDTHMLMASEMCTICSMNYTFIGRMENFKTDSSEIFRKFNIEQNFKNDRTSLSSLAAMDAIEDSIGSPFSWKKDITKCMDWYQALLRIWRKLQMRGLIEMKHKLPTTRETAASMTRKTMLKIAFIAHQASNPSVLKEQKRQVLIEMFRSVPEGVLNEFRHVYRMDFELFNYDESPGYIFNRTIPYRPRNFTDFTN